MNKFAFVIGAHKTGTTYLNKLLQLNQESLLREKIWFEASGTVRPNISAHLGERPNSSVSRGIRDYIRSDKTAFERVIFSNENIAGQIPGFFTHGRIYPTIAKRLNNLFEINEHRPVDLYFFIRPYETFVSSCYSEFIRTKGLDVSFQAFQDKIFATEPSWVDVVQEVESAYPTATVKVLQQSDISQNINLVLKAIAGCDLGDLKQPAKFEGRHSMSSSGMDVLALMDHFGYTNVAPEFINSLARILPSSEQFGRPFSMAEADIDYYKSRYREHLGSLAASGSLVKASI